MKTKETKVQLNLEKYPNLKKVYYEKPNQFKDLLQGAMQLVDEAIEKKHTVHAENVYNQEYMEFTRTVMEAFFNTDKIAEKHHNKAEVNALKELKEDLHPLAIFTNDAPVYDARGKNMAPSEWINQEQFNLQDWLYSLFYAARFVSWKDLADYLTLNQYDLVEQMKVQNFDHLASIQPVLEYQEKHGIPKGKLIKGYGLFDCVTDEEVKSECPSCHKVVVANKNIVYCPSCRGGFRV